MRLILLIIISLISCNENRKENPNPISNKSSVSNKDKIAGITLPPPDNWDDSKFPDEKAIYPGGNGNLLNYLTKNASDIILDAKENQCSSTIYFSILIDSVGKAVFNKILGSAVCELDIENFDTLISDMPIWTPARRKEKDVSSEFIIPLRICLK